jgi:hypothetical protein
MRLEGTPLLIRITCPKARLLPICSRIPWLEVSDWVSFDHDFRSSVYIPGLNRLIREVWQRRLAVGREWVSRRKWLGSHPFVVEPRPWPGQESNLRSLDWPIPASTSWPDERS